MAILPIDGGRYGTPEMRAVFGDQRKVDYQVRIEGAVAAAQGQLGIIPERAARNIMHAAAPGEVTVERVALLEAKSDHDTAALVEALAEKCTITARPWVHYGLTSNDLVDTSNSMQMADALAIIMPKIAKLAHMLADMALKYESLPAVGRTHGQHASIISFGLKFANWAEEMAEHHRRLTQAKSRIIICKTLGVVGTGSLMGRAAVDVQRRVAKSLGMRPATVATQVVPRERYAEYVFGLVLVGSTLEKMAVEIRNLQRTEIGEVAEQFAEGQMGSSAVPVKRNPIKSERITSLSRLLRSQLGVALENIPLWHERDLSNSANERFIIPTCSILLDAMLQTTINILPNLGVNRDRILENLEKTRGQIYAEFVMDALIRRGMTRFEAYRNVQRVAFQAAEKRTHFRDAVTIDDTIFKALDRQTIDKIFEASSHLGASKDIIRGVAKSIHDAGRS